MIKIIINPSSAKGLKLWKDVKKRLEESHIKYDSVITWQGHTTHVAKKAQEEGFKKIFIVGGDGTINEAINGLDLEDIILGIIPAGCGNDFAKMLGIKSIEDGISSILSGYIKLVDVGFVNNRYFINNLGVGLDARIVYIADRLGNIKNRVKYLVSALTTLLNFPAFNVKIESKDYKFSGHVLGISVGNGKFHGGLFSLTPRAQIDDGLLDICVIKEISRLKRFFNVQKAIRGTHIFLKETQIFTADSFSIYSKTPFHIHVDGEFVNRPLNKLEVKILNKQLQFCLPAKDI